MKKMRKPIRVLYISCIGLLVIVPFALFIITRMGYTVELLSPGEWGFGTTSLVIHQDGLYGSSSSLVYGKTTRLGVIKVSSLNELGKANMRGYTGK